MPKPDRLPSLDALLTFEVAARHLSFTRAGEERFITQSAVSRQIRGLEDDLGVSLFERRHRALALTDDGALLLTACQAGLQHLRDGVARVRQRVGRHQVVVTTTPGLASLWLIPRLSGFTSAHPGVDVRLDASFARRDLEADGIDLAIRYADPRYAEGDKLFDEEFTLVCSPALLAPGQPALRVPADLARHTLLRTEDHVGAGPLADWRPWLVSMGVPDLQPSAVLTFSSYDDVINAALHGQGAAMGRRPLIDRLLAEGRLVRPLAGELASDRAFHVVLAAGPAGQRAPVQAFRRWLLAQAKAAGPAGIDAMPI